MKKLSFFLLFAPFSLFSQILELNVPLFSEEPFFNAKFIKANRVESIIGSRSSKKVNDIIRSKGLDYRYDFYENGSLKQQLSTFLVGTTYKDTTVISYIYNDSLQLITKRKNDSYGFYSHNYIWEKGAIVKETYCRDENLCPHKNEFQLGSQFIITSETYKYKQLAKSQLKKQYYNNYGKLYKETIIYTNEHGYLTETFTKYVIGNNKTRVKYNYDENGRIIEKKTTTTIINTNTITEKYSYDGVGNILEINIFKDEEHSKIKQFLYDKNTFLLTAQLIKDVPSQLIQIIQYRYEFYDKKVNFSDSTSTFNTID